MMYAWYAVSSSSGRLANCCRMMSALDGLLCIVASTAAYNKTDDIGKRKEMDTIPFLTRSGVSLFFEIFSTRGGELKPIDKNIRVTTRKSRIQQLA